MLLQTFLQGACVVPLEWILVDLGRLYRQTRTHGFPLSVASASDLGRIIHQRFTIARLYAQNQRASRPPKTLQRFLEGACAVLLSKCRSTLGVFRGNEEDALDPFTSGTRYRLRTRH